MDFNTLCDVLSGFEMRTVKADLAILRPASPRTKRGLVDEPSVGVLMVREPALRDDSAVEEAAHWHRIKREMRIWVGCNTCLPLHRDRFQNAFWQGSSLVIRYPGWYWRITRLSFK